MSGTEERKLAAIMFTDMVGYSALSQRNEELAQELLEEHRALLRSIFPRSHGHEIKTVGDAFLVEFFSALEAAQCAIEIQRALARRNSDEAAGRHIDLRIGIHVGDVLHRDGDVYGDGVNIASRIEPLAEAGGICISNAVYEQVRNTLGTRFEKLAPTALKNIAVPMELFRVILPWAAPAKSEERRRADSAKGRSLNAVVALAAATAVAVAVWWFVARPSQPPKPAINPPTESLAQVITAPPTTVPVPAPVPDVKIPEKSIAVLPFDNLSEEKDNAFFTNGMQDEILTDLARVAELKVISRSSVMHYKTGVQRNVREIGQALGVAYVLEGSVQRAGGKVRVTAQLIDTRSDAHVWAQRYDRDLADVFAIQSEVAEAIAAQLRAKISPAEKMAMTQPPTKDIVAYDLYRRALAVKDSTRSSVNDKETLDDAVRLFEAAIARDPSFLLAYAQLALTHDLIYWFNYDHSETRLAFAEAAVKAAEKLNPDAGESKLARGVHSYWGRRDLTAARRELEAARRLLPNDSQVASFLGLIDRREGRWDDAIQNLRRASELDPRNRSLVFNRWTTYLMLRRYADAAEVVRQNAEILSAETTRFILGTTEVAWTADMKPLRAHYTEVATLGPGGARDVSGGSFDLAVLERNPVAAARALGAIPEAGFTDQEGFPSPRAWFAGRLARMRGDGAAAEAAFKIARVELEQVLQNQGETAPALDRLATIDAYLGRRDDAVREAQRACELVPFSRDKIDAPRYLHETAEVYAILGEKDLALEVLAVTTSHPGWTSYGDLRLNPDWDSLRGDPRFEAFVAKLAPKERPK